MRRLLRLFVVFFLLTTFVFSATSKQERRVTALPEVVVKSDKKKMLHIVAYMREYSSLTTYSDTVFLFREKLVDFMIPSERSKRSVGWTNPRVLNSKSYYHFSNSSGLDSVSDKCNFHFAWSDWMNIMPEFNMPSQLASRNTGTEIRYGRYSPMETWDKAGDCVRVDVDVLADITARDWVPQFEYFLKNKSVDFEYFRLSAEYENVLDRRVRPSDLTRYSISIDSRGRGHRLFRFNRHDEPYFVTTNTEVYILDKEYITAKESRQWENNKFNEEDIEIVAPPDAPAYGQEISELIARVENLDYTRIRLASQPDRRLMSKEREKLNFGKQVLKRLKGIFGIDNISGKRKREKEWRVYRKNQLEKNNLRYDGD